MIAVSTGVIATYPVGGVAWDYGQYALGLERLGFEVYYLEDAGLYTYDADRNGYTDDPSYGVSFLESSLTSLSPDLGKRWHFRSVGDQTYGLGQDAIEEIVASADVFVNVSGMCLMRDTYMASKRKLLIDTDPGWNHFVQYPKADANPQPEGFHGFREHDYFFTYAQKLGTRGCTLPALGINWHPTRPPVVMDAWPDAAPGETWTTVLSWDNYEKPVEHDGRSYGSKTMEFPRFETLPSLVDARLEIAAGGNAPPVERWRELGWSVVESTSISRTPSDYRSYIQGSRGEFSVAKNIYTETRSGWFSCRSVCYLASGRPVVVQDTGWSDVIPTGDGLLTFTDLDAAVAAVKEVESDYGRHRAGAREVAREYFSAETVLGEMLSRAGLG